VEDERRSRPEVRLGRLVASYQRTLSRYRQISALSKQAVHMLKDGCPLPEVNTKLARKKMLLNEIREEEERVKGEREWWKRSRQTLPAQECRELLSLLDAIGKTLEEAIEQEEECRVLLKERAVWKGTVSAGQGLPGPPAVAAYRAASPVAEGDR
jgi:hypothetical protein